jgi:hypothetical protein
MMNRLLLATILLATSLSNDIGHGGGIVVVAAEDAHPQCDEWASTGECSLNPTYMWSNCADACGKLAETEKTMSAEIGEWIMMYFYLYAANTSRLFHCSIITSRHS